MSARKARVVLDHIRGRTVPEARTILAFTQRAAAVEIEKVLRSAVANAETTEKPKRQAESKRRAKKQEGAAA